MPERKSRKLPKRVCENCGRKYQPRRSTSRFDTDACRLAKWIERHPRVGVGA